MENKNTMVGRHQELALLQEIISSPKAELVAVYGRRRIGKTFLIDKTFDAKYDFYTTGIYEGTRKTNELCNPTWHLCEEEVQGSQGLDGGVPYASWVYRDFA